MNLYLLERKDLVGYDENDAFVIRAESSSKARKMANEKAADEGEIWTFTDRVTCIQLKQEDVSEIILRSFNAG